MGEHKGKQWSDKFWCRGKMEQATGHSPAPQSYLVGSTHSIDLSDIKEKRHDNLGQEANNNKSLDVLVVRWSTGTRTVVLQGLQNFPVRTACRKSGDVFLYLLCLRLHISYWSFAISKHFWASNCSKQTLPRELKSTWAPSPHSQGQLQLPILPVRAECHCSKTNGCAHYLFPALNE